MNNKIISIFLILIMLFGCATADDSPKIPETTQQTTAQTQPVDTSITSKPDETLSVDTIKYPHTIESKDIIKKSFEEPVFPQPNPRVPYYFYNDIETRTESYSIPCPYGNCTASLSQLRYFANLDVMTYVNQRIALLLSDWIDKGLPMYPGFFVAFRDAKVVKVDFSASIGQTINDIMPLTLSTVAALSNSEHIFDEQVIYFDLSNGRELSMNDIMNSNKGAESFSNLVFHTIDAFLTSDEADSSFLYQVPFHGKFETLPPSTSISTSPWGSWVTLNVDCSNCRYSHDIGQSNSKQFYLPPNAITLLERHFKKDPSDYISSGKIQLNTFTGWFENGFSDPNSTIVIDEQKGLTLMSPDTSKIYPYLVKETQPLILEMLMDVKSIAKAAKIELSKETFTASLGYSKGNFTDTIQLHYSIFNGSTNHSGSIIRNYNPYTKQKLQLRDLFRTEFDYHTFMESRITRSNVGIINMTRKEVFQNIDNYDFILSPDNITLQSKPILNKQSPIEFEQIYLEYSWDSIGLSNLSPYIMEPKGD